MSTEENKEIVKKFFSLSCQLKVSETMDMLADDAKWWIPTDRPGGMTVSKEQMRGMISAFASILDKPPEFEFGRITAEDDRVCVEMTSRGGLTKGGAPYSNDYHMFVRVKDGKIVEVKEYLNPIMAGPMAPELQALKQGA